MEAIRLERLKGLAFLRQALHLAHGLKNYLKEAEPFYLLLSSCYLATIDILLLCHVQG